MKKITSIDNARHLWSVSGCFGEAYGAVEHDGNKVFFNGDGYTVVSEFENHENGVVLRKGKIINKSDKNISVNCAMSKLIFNGGEYEVYSQYNGWQNESRGGWQELVTAVRAASSGVRSAMGATPFVVLWNKQTNRGTAVHLLASSAWEMNVTRVYEDGETSTIEIEAGISCRNLMVDLKPGEALDLPEIIYYDVTNKTDMDCWKIHNYCNKVYPKRSLPVMFNTWFYKFDTIDYDNVTAQIKFAADIGAEYFVIDAGWFGAGGNWYICRGDWEENMTSAFAGKMKDVADKVRESGMKFGFWIEAESAHEKSKVVEKYPQYFFESNGRYFIDFANPEAVDYIYGVTDSLINKYGAEFIKFDFNQNTPFDDNCNSFVDYFEGHLEYIRRLRENHPEVYLENCASGGMRTNINSCRDFDSIWVTDNQSPYDGMRIYRESMLRMPPQMLEKWVAIHSLSDFEPAYYSSKEKILSTDDATWSRAVSIDQSFLEGYLLGGPFGFTCDLSQLSDVTYGRLKEFVAGFKADREFWQNAVCRILTDTPSMTVYEYSDTEFDRVKILVFSNRIYQRNIDVYPVLDENAEYEMADGMVVSGSELAECGMDIPLETNYKCIITELKKK